jgi:GH25 family lysozyme M1 (1,4-beta-N-acetylmuramidase)
MLRFWKRGNTARETEPNRAIHHSIDVVEPLEQRVLLARAAGVDVSYYQGPSIDWASVKAAGISFAAIRASTGSSSNTYNDPYLATNEANARAAGIITGVYHFAYPQNNTAVAEATHFVNTAGKYMGPGFLPPELDLEEDGSSTAAGIAYLSQWANDFCNYVYTHTGAKPMIYLNTNYAQNYVNTSVSQWYLWIANYNYSSTGDPPVGDSNSGWPASSWNFFQYTSTGSVSGISGNVDRDVYDGTLTQLQAFVNPGPEIAVTQSGNDVVSGSSSFNLGTIINGTTNTSISFVVKNAGGSTLTLGTPTLPTGFSITDTLRDSLAGGASDPFTIKLDNGTSGYKTGLVSIATNDSNENPFTFKLVGIVQPKAPSTLVVTANSNNSVTLGWTDVSDESQFEIERKTGSNGVYAQIGTAAADATTYTDTSNLSPNTTYYYRVRDSVISTIFSAYSNEISTTTLTDAPAGVAATDGTRSDAVQVTWLAVSGATGYSIWRSSTSNSDDAVQIGTATGLLYDDTAVAGDTVANYWVRAINSASQPSAFSNSDSGYRDTTDPSVAATSFYLDALPQAVVVQFSEDVGSSLDVTDLSVQDQSNLDQPAIHPTSVSYDPNTDVATFSFSSQLPNADYRATIAANDVKDAAQNPMAADLTYDFFFLVGDANRNGSVDLQDFNVLASNFGKSGMTFSQGNYDYSSDGDVSITDFNLLASNFGKSVQTPTSPQTVQAATSTMQHGVVGDSTSTKPQTQGPLSSSSDDRLLRDSGLL